MSVTGGPQGKQTAWIVERHPKLVFQLLVWTGTRVKVMSEDLKKSDLVDRIRPMNLPAWVVCKTTNHVVARNKIKVIIGG